IDTGEPVVTPNLVERLRKHPALQGQDMAWLEEVPWCTAMDMPMVSRGEPLGVMVVAYDHVFEPSRETMDLIAAIADQAAIAVDNVRLFEDSELRAKEAAALAAVASGTTLGESIRA